MIIGLNTSNNPKLSIIGSLLVIAFADNISDALGIHIYQEAEGLKEKNAWTLTLTNFLARLFISLGFIVIMAVAPTSVSVAISTFYGLSVLTIISYIIALQRNKPLPEIIEHLIFAVLVIILSKYFSAFILQKFKHI